MNNKTGKILVGIGLGLLGIFGIYKIVKAYKKGMEEIEDQEFQETEDLENAGVNTGKLKDEINDEEEDFTKMLYTAVRFNSEFDIDLLDIDGVIDNLDYKVIHVRQFDTKTKHNKYRRRLDFLIDIPDYTGLSYRGPKIGNFLSTFKEAAIYMSENIVRFSPPASRRLIGSAVISRKINGNDVIEYRELKDVVYKQFSDEGHDGLTKFYYIEKEKINQIGALEYTKDADWIFTNCPDLSKDDDTLVIENIVLQYMISFQIRSNRPDELYGIDVKTGIECIKYLTEQLYVGREESKKKVEYRHLMFNAPNEDGTPDLSWYYTTDEDDRVIIDNIVGFDDED